MLPRPLLRRFSPLLTAYLLVATVGLPLQRVYCSCVEETWVTLASEAHECRARERATVPVQHACCQRSCTSQPEADRPHDCGDSSVVLAGIDGDLQVTQTVSFPDSPVDILARPPVRGEWRGAGVIREVRTASPTWRGPPPLGGRGLLVRYGRFLI